MPVTTTPPIITIISFATAWGPKFGGINAFNTELLKSLSLLPERIYHLICVVQDAHQNDVIEATSCGIELLALKYDLTKVSNQSAQACLELLKETGLNVKAPIILLGHDDKTGPLTLFMRKILPCSKVVLIHHMAHGAYQSFKKDSSVSGTQKQQMQRNLFVDADLCLAVGPMLESQLNDLLATSVKRPSVRMLIPGLDDLDNFGVAIADKPPANFVAFIAGRLSREDDRIKQGILALRAFGNAVRRTATAQEHGSNALRQSPKLCMRGVLESEEKMLASLLKDSAGGELARDFAGYTEDRNAYYTSLASASVALMPSWHEGFGLTAWEAIACSLPVIIGEQSGVYRFLNEICSGAGLAHGHSIRVVNVQGYTPDVDGNFNHTEADVSAVAEHLVTLGQNLANVKEKAKQLRDNLLRMDYDWHGCAQKFVSALSETFQLTLQDQLETATKALTIKKIASTTNLFEQAHLPVSLRLPPARPWRHLIDPPSQLLTARDEIVPFDKFRQAELDSLITWAKTPEQVELALVTAPGGSGKTRLAFEFARHTQRDDCWHSLWLGNDLPPNWEGEFRSVMLSDDSQHLLLVVDYAEARQIELLAILRTVIELLPIIKRKIRILMLARSATWWQDLPTTIECSESVASWLTEKCSVTQIDLPSWRSNLASRTESYRAALVAFAEALGTSVPTYTPDLTGDAFSLPVYLHIAALAALNGHRPHSASALLEGQLRHEWRYFRLRNSGAYFQYDDWADAMAWLVLRQSSQSTSFSHALVKLDINAHHLLSALKQSYPAPGGLAGLQPDLLAECLLRQRLAHNRGALILELALLDDDDATTCDKVLNVLGRLSTNKEGTTDDKATIASWQQVLASGLANVWPRLDTILIDAAHRSEAGLGALLCHSWRKLPPDVQATLATKMDFPKYSTNLIQLSVLVSEVYLQHAKTPSTRAKALDRLSIALARQGDAASRIEALRCAFDSLEIYRELVNSKRKTYLPKVAMSLNNLSIRLAERGDAKSRNEALNYARESLEIYRELTLIHRTAYLPALATALNNLANRLAERGDALSKTEALDCARESVAIQQELTEAQRTTYLPNLAMSLSNLANRLAEQGDAMSRAEALVCARASVKIQRELTLMQRAAYLPSLATSLNNLSNRLGEQGDAVSRTEALGCARESVEIRRGLTKTQRTAYLPKLASSLNNLSNCLSKQVGTASRSEALVYAQESMEIQRELVETQPLIYLPKLAMSLNNLVSRLSEQGNALSETKGLDYARESVEIRRKLAKNQSAAYLPVLAKSLNNLANLLSKQGGKASKREAFECARESVSIFLWLQTTHLKRFEENLNMTTRTFKKICVKNGQNADQELSQLRMILDNKQVTMAYCVEKRRYVYVGNPASFRGL